MHVKRLHRGVLSSVYARSLIGRILLAADRTAGIVLCCHPSLLITTIKPSEREQSKRREIRNVESNWDTSARTWRRQHERQSWMEISVLWRAWRSTGNDTRTSSNSCPVRSHIYMLQTTVYSGPMMTKPRVWSC